MTSGNARGAVATGAGIGKHRAKAPAPKGPRITGAGCDPVRMAATEAAKNILRGAGRIVAIAMAAGVLGTQPVVAAGAWDGLWVLDASASHYSGHSFTLMQEADGTWRYDDGASSYSFRADGRPWPERLASDFHIIARKNGNAFDIVERGYGRDMERSHRVLSPGGNRITGSDTYIYPDGRETTSPIFALRVGSGSGFDGTWNVPAGSQPVVKNAIATSPPHFVISTAEDGTMMWFLPATGELIRGRADGRFRPLVGPQQPTNRNFAWRWLGARKLLFTCRDGDQVIESAVEELSPDGRTFTDTLWSAGHNNEKDVRVLVKR
jgi:hypothetical protein